VARQRTIPKDCLVVERDQPLIGIPGEEDGREVTYFFAGEAPTAESTPAQDAPRGSRFAGVWSDLDWEETVTALERIRKESSPSPPIEV
jgi:hypothetical protein